MKAQPDPRPDASGWIDISAPLRDGMVHWPGDPPVRIRRVADVERGDACTLSEISLGAHSGTHVDAPLHFLAGAPGVDLMPLDALVGRARVLEIRDGESIKPAELAPARIRAGERILFKTRNSAGRWQTDEFREDFVFISREAAEFLAARRVRAVGVDYLSVGGYHHDGEEVHRRLLGAGVWLIEGLDLSRVRAGRYQLVCLPLRIEGGDGAPARALLRPIGPGAGIVLDQGKAFDEALDRSFSGKGAQDPPPDTRKATRPVTALGSYAAAVRAALDRLTEEDVVRRIWRKDHTVWKPDPAEITDRLGWLTVSDAMRERLSMLTAFAGEVREAGFRHGVLLGMGGSSLGAEVLRQTLGSAAGYPELVVLDSTVPEAVRAVRGATDPAHTLFLVSSKSGTTTEPMALYRFFRGEVEKAEGRGEAGANFVAITDPGTPLVRLAAAERFRRVFLNPADIGGRYSVLSYFGLVPAALTGANTGLLLDRADSIKEACAVHAPHQENPGLWLGAVMGTLALAGRDKLTLVTSPTVSSFGLWAEQLVAESTGKEGRGIVPVAGEPPVAARHYGDDRLFVYLRLNGDDNSATDRSVGEAARAGHPVVVLDMRDRYDLGTEFFRWEFATAVAGAILGINPFDQPNVQQAKEATERALGEFRQAGRLPPLASTGTLRELLASATPGRYLAVMAYLRQTPEMDRAFAALRRRVTERHGIATTLGYGPRFLHSTGQLHKGGPASGLFLQITAAHDGNLPIPGEPYGFGVVADAQALGDFQALRASVQAVVRVHLSVADADLLAHLADGLA